MVAESVSGSRPGRTRPAPGRHRAEQGGTIGSVLDPRLNGLNLLRLIMASGVIIYHGFRLSGTPIPAAPLEQALQNLWVDGFFVLSGFLILGSWMRHPHVGDYLRNRLLRIYPAFLVCLVLTAFVLAPLGVALTGEHLDLMSQARYVVVNLGILIRDYDIAGTPASVPWPHAWNGSLWTLFWEFLCYLGVMGLGLAGVFRQRWGVPVVFAGAWLLQAAVAVSPRLGAIQVPLGMYRIGALQVGEGARFALTFAAGMLIYHLRDRLRASWLWVAAAGLGVVASMWLPQYRLVGGLLLAYLLVTAGALLHRRRTALRTDISYGVYIYAFPVQQILAMAGLYRAGLFVYMLSAWLLTAPIALLSWRFIERPALTLKAR